MLRWWDRSVGVRVSSESGGERAEKRASARAEVRGRDKSKDWR